LLQQGNENKIHPKQDIFFKTSSKLESKIKLTSPTDCHIFTVTPKLQDCHIFTSNNFIIRHMEANMVRYFNLWVISHLPKGYYSSCMFSYRQLQILLSFLAVWLFNISMEAEQLFTKKFIGTKHEFVKICHKTRFSSKWISYYNEANITVQSPLGRMHKLRSKPKPKPQMS